MADMQMPDSEESSGGFIPAGGGIRPTNYTAQFAGIRRPDTAFFTGVKQADAMQDMLRVNAENVRKQQNQLQMEADIAALHKAPTLDGVQSIILKYPQLSAPYKPIMDAMTEEQQNVKTQQAAEILAPLMAGDREGGIAALAKLKEASKNSGKPTDSVDLMINMVKSAETGEAGDNAVVLGVGLPLAAQLGSNFKQTLEPMIKAWADMKKLPLEQQKTQSEIDKNEAAAENAGGFTGMHPATSTTTGEDVIIQVNAQGKTRELPGYKPKPGMIGIGTGGDSELSPEAVSMLVDKYLATGTLDADISARNPGLRNRIINMAAKKAAGTGGGDLAAAKGDYKSNMASLVAMQKQRDQMVTFEKTALKNLDQFLSLAEKMPDKGSQWLNTPLRSLAAGGFGSTVQAAAKTALMVVRPEFAKINQGALTGVLSDSARKEVESAMPDNATFGQYIAISKVLKQDAANRHEFYDKILAEIRDRMKGQKDIETPVPTTGKQNYEGEVSPSGAYIWSGGKWIANPKKGR